MKTFIIKHAWRSITRTRTYTWINIVGLVISFVGAIIIARYVHQEFSVDSYVPDIDRTYLVVDKHSGEGSYSLTRCMNLGNASNFDNILADRDVEFATNFTCIYRDLAAIVGDKSYTPRLICIENTFFDIFPRTLVSGRRELREENEAIVTTLFAEQVWGKENPLGQKMTVQFKEYVVVGVVEPTGVKANFDFDMLILDKPLNWGYIGNSVCRLKEGADWREVNSRHFAYTEDSNAMNAFHFQLQPLDGAYFNSAIKRYNDFAHEFLLSGDIRSVTILIVAAIMLFAVGLFNYVNIFAIVSLCRRKNFVVRKVFGANRGVIFAQILAENIIVTGLAVALSWCVIAVVSPLVANYYSISQVPAPMFDIELSVAIILVFSLIITVPATVSLCRATLHNDNENAGHIPMRQMCLLAQYVLAFFLTVASLYSMFQFRYMLNSDLGYHTTDIINVNMLPETRSFVYTYDMDESYYQQKRMEIFQKAMSISERLRQEPLVVNHAFDENSSASLTHSNSEDITLYVKCAGKDQEYVNCEYIQMSFDEMELYDIKLTGGLKREDVFGKEDSWRPVMFVSESLSKQLGITDVHSVMLEQRRDLGEGRVQTDPIHGVVSDFRSYTIGLDDKPKLLCVYDGPVGDLGSMLVRVVPDKHDEALAVLKKIFAEEVGENEVMEYSWIEDEIAELYADDSRTALIYTTFALLSILVSCLGLFGISLYDIQRRRREIAIRKVNGAKFPDIFRIVVRRYIVAWGISVVIGIPLAIFALRSYMEGYVDHIDLSPVYFVVSALLLLAISVVTIYLQVKRASSENPSVVMKAE